MRSFALFALVAGAVATTSSETIQYDATVYITSTVTRINTITASSSPTGVPMNQTSTIVASHPTMAASYHVGNGTTVAPTASSPTAVLPSASAPAFTGAASALSSSNAYLAVIAAGLGYLVL